MKTIISFSCIVLLLATIASCGDRAPSEIEPELYTYKVPSKLNDGIDIDSMQNYGFYVPKLEEMVNQINLLQGHNIHSILIVKNSKLVFEKYFEGYLFDTKYIQSEGELIEYNTETLHFLASISKSVTSLTLGIAIDEGYDIKLSDPITKFYPEFSNQIVGEKSKITIQHLLTMSTGLQWDETTYSYTDPRNDNYKFLISSNPIRYVLEKPLEFEPGEKFKYNSGCTNIIADIIQKQIKIPLLDYIKLKLFEPLGIDNYRWDMINDSLILASGGLYLSARSLAKIGILLNNGGVWKGKRIISSNWIEQSTSLKIPTNYYYFADGYGFQWWINTFNTYVKSYDSYFAAGWGEQYLYVFPNEKLSVVINCGYFFDEVYLSPHSILYDYILPSMEIGN